MICECRVGTKMCSVEYHSGNSLLLLMPVLFAVIMTSRDNCNTDVQFFFTTKVVQVENSF